MRLDLRFILPGATARTVLLDDAGRLPAAAVERDEDDAAIVPVDAFLRERWDFDEPVLEVHPRWAGVPEGEPIPTLVTTESAPATWRPPPGFAFGPMPGDVDDLVDSIRPRAVELLGELRTGAQPPELRPRWARPGWRRRASDWMRAAAAGAGRPLTGEPRPFFLRGISALLIAPTAGGDVFLKAVFPIFHAEPVITKLLADRLPRDVPRVLAIEPDEGWLAGRGHRLALDREPAGGRPAGGAGGRGADPDRDPADDRGPAGRPRGPARGRGTGPEPGRDPRRVRRRDRPTAGPDRAVGPLADGVRADAVARVDAAVARLAELPFPVSLVHGDFHSENAALVDDRIVVIDWSDAAVGSPLVDLSHGSPGAATARGRDRRGDRRLGRRLVAGRARRRRSARGLDDILVAGAAYQVISYDAIVRASSRRPATR